MIKPSLTAPSPAGLADTDYPLRYNRDARIIPSIGFKNLMAAKLKEGDKAPNFAVPDAEGKTVR